jgi:hypothetical protein
MFSLHLIASQLQRLVLPWVELFHETELMLIILNGMFEGW